MMSAMLDQTCRLSADGSVLSYGDIVDGKSGTFVVTGRDSAGREVCQDCEILDFYADPNFAVSQDKGNALCRLNLATGARTTILEAGAGRISESALSPDDRWVAFVLNEPGGRVAICVAPLTGGGAPSPEKDWVRLFDEDRYLGSPAWSADGSQLYYLSEREGACAVWVQKLDSKSKRPAGSSRLFFRPTQRDLNLNMPRGDGRVAVAANKLVVWAGQATSNIYLAAPKRK